MKNVIITIEPVAGPLFDNGPVQIHWRLPDKKKKKQWETREAYGISSVQFMLENLVNAIMREVFPEEKESDAAGEIHDATSGEEKGGNPHARTR